MTQWRPLGELRPHPENALIFGDPEESETFSDLVASLRQDGFWTTHPVVIRADGTILAGHLRAKAAAKLKIAVVPVVVHDPFDSYHDELRFIIKCNTARRQLTKSEIALAFKRLRETPKEAGGTKGKRGGNGSNQHTSKPSASGRIASPAAAAEAASMLGVGKHEARALETVFTTPGVPDEVKRAVNAGDLKPTPAANAIKTEVKRQGGEIKDPAPLRIVATPKQEKAAAKSETSERPAHETRMADEAARFAQDYQALFELYRKVDGVLTRRPLKTVLGPTEHHQYLELIRDLSLRAWREIESVQGQTNAGRQMALVALDGGK